MSLRETVPTLTDAVNHTLDGWARRLANARTWYAANEQASRELETYTDRELVDLGISRADIPDIARQHADLAVAAR